jgi:hypothetical protein
MVKVALLGASYAAQLKENPDALAGLNVVHCGASVEAFREQVPSLHPDAVVLDLGELTDAPDAAIRAIIESSGAELVMVTFTFARRHLIRSLQKQSMRIVQAPLSLSMLRAHLGSLIVRDLLSPTMRADEKGEGRALRRVTAESLQATANALLATPMPPAPRFSKEQLGRLLEIASSVQCECPNQLAGIVNTLRGFEDYSRDCENRDDEDARMHALLFRKTGAARAVMEEALVALMKHERIEV